MVPQNVPLELLERIADHLIEKGYVIIDDFLNQEQVDELVERILFHREEGNLHKAGIGKPEDYQVIHEVRGDYIQWIDREKNPLFFSYYVDRIKEIARFLNRTCFLGLRDYEMHMTVYPPGAGYERHVDAFQKDDNRRLTAVCYLNSSWTPGDGGELLLYPVTDGGEEGIIVSPLGGRLALFESTMAHEVLPAKEQRFSITGWMLNERHLQGEGID